MNRNLTNGIRYIMDEFIPPIIRDSKWFMYPFYYIAYGGKNIREMMNFKRNIYNMSPENYVKLYSELNSISRKRLTDLNKASINFILEEIGSIQIENLIDLGCGGGFMLRTIHQKFPHIKLTGLDVKSDESEKPYSFIEGNLEKLPFHDKSFDIVICCHTIEHLLSLDTCIQEMLRICKKKLIIITPKQRYYYYTLDEHINFFPIKESLIHRIPVTNYKCQQMQGDWNYVANLQKPL